MDQVEQWFSILQRKRFTYANFKSLDELEKQLKKFIEQWNEQAHGFKWDEKTRMKLEVFINKVKERTQMAQDAMKQANVAWTLCISWIPSVNYNYTRGRINLPENKNSLHKVV